jgi:hypothetical protein
VYARGRVPQRRAASGVGLEIAGGGQQRQGVIDLVAAHGELGCTPHPGDRLGAQIARPLRLVRPREVRVRGRDRFAVVVREQRRVLVAPTAGALEPRGEARVHAGAGDDRQRAVRDLARERVFECQLALARQRRTRDAAGEVALDEQTEPVPRRPGELTHGSLPERAADHRCCLQGRLIGRRKHVDTGCDHVLDRVRQHERVGHPGGRPSRARPAQGAALDQRCEHLLDEERVSLGAVEHLCGDVWRQAGREAVKHRRRLLEAERLKVQARAVAGRGAPSGTAAEQLRPRRRRNQQRAGHLAHALSEQV